MILRQKVNATAFPTSVVLVKSPTLMSLCTADLMVFGERGGYTLSYAHPETRINKKNDQKLKMSQKKKKKKKKRISGLRIQAAYEPTLLTSTGQTKSICKPLNSPSPPALFPLFTSISFLCKPRHSSCDFYPSFPLSLFYSLSLLLRPSRPCALRRRAGCRRRTGP